MNISSTTERLDEEFIYTWERRYDDHESDEPDYQRLIRRVNRDMEIIGSIDIETFKDIWKWKKAWRVFGKIDLSLFDTKYRDAFLRASQNLTGNPLQYLCGPSHKLPGIAEPTASTILHFILPSEIPIIDIRTVETLFFLKRISFVKRSNFYQGYPEFRATISKIHDTFPKFTLRQIDRALFSFHKINRSSWNL